MNLNFSQKQIFNKLSDTQVYLYCTPKCGGSSLYESLKVSYNSFHVHSQEFFEKYFQENEIVNNSFKIIDCIEESRKKYDEIYIIDVYRKPVERNMSYFFHIIEDLVDNYEKRTTQELIEYFNTNLYFQYNQSIEEVAQYYNVDLYQLPFDQNKMYLEFKYNNINFIILHFDYINSWEGILYDIFNKKIPILDRNIGEKKNYANIYKDYKNKYKIPKIIFEFIQQEKNFNYFNDENMKAKYIEDWEKRIDYNLETCTIPDNFDPNIYKSKNQDLNRMNELELLWHYSLFGIKETREY